MKLPTKEQCLEWCRDWRETQGGKYPASNHAPGCDEYKLEEFSRVEHDGTSCTTQLFTTEKRT